MASIDVYKTHIEVYPYHKNDIPYIEDMYTATDKFTNQNYACGYIIDNEKLYLPRGTAISKLEKVLETTANYIDENDPIEIMSMNHHSLYEPRNKIQEESIAFLKEETPQIALNLKTGIGKCESVSTKIPSPDTDCGYKLMGDINPGDHVYDYYGNPTTVLQTFPQGIKDIYKITFNDGRFSQCGKEHLWEIVLIHRESGIEYHNVVLMTEQISYLISTKHYDIFVPAFIDKTMTERTQLKIESIEWNRREEAQCILVDHPRHLYVTEQYIITHNTFCVAYASTDIGDRTLVITPNESLKQQWIKTYNTMFDYRPKHLLNISGSNVIESIMDDRRNIDDVDVFFVNHQTLRSYMTNTNPYQFHNFFKKLKVGIKVYDESHMEFGNILLIDFFSNTKRTWYLTATFDRSDKTESACFRRAFQSVESYGDIESAEVVRKHVVYHKVNINSHITPQLRAKLLGYPGFNSNKYGTYAIFDDTNKTLYKSILEILKKTVNVEGKTLIFLPLIDCVEDVVENLKKDFPEKSVAAYHSKIPKDEKEIAEKKDIIVSTIKSCGTGRDIKGLRILICAEPVVSKVVIEQVIGRLRPYSPDKDTYYFDMVDVCIPANCWWHRARYKKIESLVKKTVILDM